MNPSVPQFHYKKVSVIKGVYFSWTCFPDDGKKLMTLELGQQNGMKQFN